MVVAVISIGEDRVATGAECEELGVGPGVCVWGVSVEVLMFGREGRLVIRGSFEATRGSLVGPLRVEVLTFMLNIDAVEQEIGRQVHSISTHRESCMGEEWLIW